VKHLASETFFVFFTIKTSLANIPNTATSADTKNFPQRRMSWISKMFCFTACLGFSLFPNYATANSLENRECSAFHIKNFEKLTQDDVERLIVRFWDNLNSINEKRLKEEHKFGNKDAKKMRCYSVCVWPNPPVMDSQSTVTLYEDGDYSVLHTTMSINCYWKILLPTEFAKSDFKKLDKSTLQKIISNHVKSRGLLPDTYRGRDFTLEKQKGRTKGQKEIYFWKVLASEDQRCLYESLYEKHYFLIYEEKPLYAEDSPQGNPVGSNKSGEKSTGKGEKKPK
jgi:hypothetical protein